MVITWFSCNHSTLNWTEWSSLVQDESRSLLEEGGGRAVTKAASLRVTTSNVLLKGTRFSFIIIQLGFDDIPNGNDARQPPIAQYREVTNVMLPHHGMRERHRLGITDRVR